MTCLRSHRAEGTELGLGKSNEHVTQPGQSDTARGFGPHLWERGFPLLWDDWPAAAMLPGWVACLVLPGALHRAHPHPGGPPCWRASRVVDRSPLDAHSDGWAPTLGWSHRHISLYCEPRAAAGLRSDKGFNVGKAEGRFQEGLSLTFLTSGRN